MVRRDLYTYIGLFLFLILGWMALRIWVLEPVTITSEMANDYLKKDEVIMAVKGVELTYADFVVYEANGKDHVGRVIGMPGDTVTFMDDVLYRNNNIISESYLDKIAYPHQEYYTEDLDIETITKGKSNKVDKDSYFILNDLRTNKKDSRTFGLISKKQIKGRLTFRVLPIKRFGYIENGLTQGS